MSIPRRETDATLAYYSRHAREYITRANAVDMSRLYAGFEPYLPAGSLVLDLGCGGGRDSRRFASLGHQVIALDPCPELLAEARRDTPLDLGRRIHYVVGASPDLPIAGSSCSAIWACASLLHLSRPAMPGALAECHRILTGGGVLWVSVKQGAGERVCDGRRFTYWEMDPLKRVVQGARFDAMATSERPSLDQPDTTWLSVLAKKP